MVHTPSSGSLSRPFPPSLQQHSGANRQRRGSPATNSAGAGHSRARSSVSAHAEASLGKNASLKFRRTRRPGGVRRGVQMGLGARWCVLHRNWLSHFSQRL